MYAFFKNNLAMWNKKLVFILLISFYVRAKLGSLGNEICKHIVS